MDTFEPIRVAAAGLHKAVVAGGCDPLRPASVVGGAIEWLELEVFYLPAGDPALKGARAVFDEQSGMICCEQRAEAVARALLVAHEIGHAEIHAGSRACTEGDIDPSRSTEAAPVGLQRVEDYGARERKELQADVFARELLFPRVFAKKLHVEDGLSSMDIANRTELPIALVRQQLFDALLLPAAPSHPESTTGGSGNGVDRSQDDAVAQRGRPFQLQAGPGTGKTRTLVRRVSSLLAEGIAPDSILVLTFSNRAAAELAQRLTSVEPMAAPRLWIGTIHAFGLELVRRFHDRLDLPSDPTLFDRSDAIEVLEEIVPTLPLVHYRNLWDPVIVLRDVITAISRAKDELADPVRYRELSQRMLESAVTDEEEVTAQKCLEVYEIYKVYEQILRKNGALDFGDLIMRPTLLLESEPTLAKTVRLRHRYLLVDEYQDVNRASARLMKILAGDGAGLWVVGDTRQAIYRFRGRPPRTWAL